MHNLYIGLGLLAAYVAGYHVGRAASVRRIFATCLTLQRTGMSLSALDSKRVLGGRPVPVDETLLAFMLSRADPRKPLD